MMSSLKLVPCAILCAVLVAIIGCDQSADTQTKPVEQKTEAAKAPAPAATQPLVPVVAIADWCKEHAMPESVCVQCNDSLAAGFKAKNDWCKEHSRPESQCFECHPELKEKFAAAYKEKYGKEPPAVAPEAK